MITILPETRGNLVAIRASGRLTHADYRDFVPQLEGIIDREGPLRLLVDLSDFEGWELKAAWDDFLLGVKHVGDFERMAMIGDRDWQKIAARVTDALTGCAVRTFGERQWDEAWAWVRQD